jgi:radical SAM superfamily enzyme YgiQ (UPF0313 family)
VGELADIMGRKRFMLPLALPTLAALTPPGYDVRILDEEMEDLPADLAPDLVGITSTLVTQKRALELADLFRARGSKVVLGGACSSFDHDTVLLHADAVVMGEAESVWEPLLADFAAGELKPRYRETTPFEFKRMPIPRWDLVDTRKLMAVGVQVSRGCPFGCEFCVVQKVFGRNHRYRDMDNVIDELKALPQRQVFFVDDNLTANKVYMREFLPRIAPLGLSWTCEVGLDVARDESFLEAMAHAGCSTMLIGFESVNPASLEETGKQQNRIDRYEEAIKRIHGVGIHVLGSFIAGFDQDDVRAFDDIADFAKRTHVSYVNLNLLTVAPGTDLHERLGREERLVDADSDRLNGMYPSFRFARMSHSQAYDAYFRILDRIYDPAEAASKGLAVLGNGAFVRPPPAVSFMEKVTGFWYLLKTYLFTRDRARQRMFLDIFALGRKGVADMGKVVEYLLFMASLRRFLDRNRGLRAATLKELQANDVPPMNGQ